MEINDVNKRKIKEERGEFTIEATIVMVITMAIIFLIINMGFVVYHKQMVTAVATRTTSDISYVYGDGFKEPFYGYMKEDYFSDNSIFRYWGVANHLKSKNVQKARWYACYLVSQYELGNEGDGYVKIGDKYYVTDSVDYYPGIQVSAGENSINQREITVSIDLKYPVLTLNPLIIFDFDPQYEVYAEAKAVCIDPMHDMMVSRLYSEIYKKVVSKSSLTSGIDALAGAINNIINIVRGIKGGD